MHDCGGGFQRFQPQYWGKKRKKPQTLNIDSENLSSGLSGLNFRVVDEATSPSKSQSKKGLVASPTTANPNFQR